MRLSLDCAKTEALLCLFNARQAPRRLIRRGPYSGRPVFGCQRRDRSSSAARRTTCGGIPAMRAVCNPKLL